MGQVKSSIAIPRIWADVMITYRLGVTANDDASVLCVVGLGHFGPNGTSMFTFLLMVLLGAVILLHQLCGARRLEVQHEGNVDGI